MTQSSVKGPHLWLLFLADILWTYFELHTLKRDLFMHVSFARLKLKKILQKWTKIQTIREGMLCCTWTFFLQTRHPLKKDLFVQVSLSEIKLKTPIKKKSDQTCRTWTVIVLGGLPRQNLMPRDDRVGALCLALLLWAFALSLPMMVWCVCVRESMSCVRVCEGGCECVCGRI